MGHKSIETTMRYAHFAPTHANRSIIEEQRRENAERERRQAGDNPSISKASRRAVMDEGELSALE
jgi:hypothetical protein